MTGFSIVLIGHLANYLTYTNRTLEFSLTEVLRWRFFVGFPFYSNVNLLNLLLLISLSPIAIFFFLHISSPPSALLHLYLQLDPSAYFNF